MCAEQHGVGQDDPAMQGGRSLIVLRHGETFLKGANRPFFEQLLERNCRRALEDCGNVTIARGQGRFYVWTSMDDRPAALRRLGTVFGISSLSPAEEASASIDEIAAAAVAATAAAVRVRRPSSFKVETKRSDKRFPITSIEVSRRVGAAIVSELGLPVDVHQPDMTVGIEIGHRQTFVFSQRLPGAGGLPVGASGNVMLLLWGGMDSPVAGNLVQKRGCRLMAVYFHSPPHTSEHARDKVERLAERLAERQNGVDLQIVGFTAVQERIRDRAPAELLVVLYRRAMMRIANRLAARHGCLALATDESIGQVASQTLQNMACIEAASDLPIIRPLLTYDKQETIALARQIDTFRTSIEPYEDCCSLFVPRHPATAVRPPRAEKAERGLEIGALLDEAVEQAELLQIATQGV